ncbi:hypothetical protein C8R42DRAFT_672655 [Lentinula raphanica]|nr:hypothetical protein C8R42DRAFT_672655 [Lentinula raphanica]
MITNVLVLSFTPFGTLSLAVTPSSTRLSIALPLLNVKYPFLSSSGLLLSTRSGAQPHDALLSSLLTNNEPDAFLSLHLSPRLLGG